MPWLIRSSAKQKLLPNLLTGLGNFNFSVAWTSIEMLGEKGWVCFLFFVFMKGFVKGNLWELENICILPEN